MEQFQILDMGVNIKVFYHLGTLNDIVFEVESIEVKINDEDKTLRLIWFIPFLYVLIKPNLIYEKKTLSFKEVASKIICKERRLKHEETLRQTQHW